MKFILSMTLALLLTSMPISCLAEQTQGTTQVIQVDTAVIYDTKAEEQSQETPKSSIGGEIKQISISEISGRVSALFDMFYESTKPIVSKLAMFMIAIAGLFLLIGIFNRRVLSNAVVAILAVGLGFLLFYNAETVVRIIMYTSEYVFGG